MFNLSNYFISKDKSFNLEVDLDLYIDRVLNNVELQSKGLRILSRCCSCQDSEFIMSTDVSIADRNSRVLTRTISAKYSYAFILKLHIIEHSFFLCCCKKPNYIYIYIYIYI